MDQDRRRGRRQPAEHGGMGEIEGEDRQLQVADH